MGPTSSTPPPSAPKRRLPLWVAALPALLIPIFLMVRATVQFSAAAKTFNPVSSDQQKSSNRLACVETYGITLNSSQLNVPEWQVGIPANSGNSTPQLSTVLRGMARNGCDENLTEIRLHFVVHDDAGRKGEGFFLINSLSTGDAKPFEKAWMGRVASYEITASR
jgi:hypothetical protein